MDYVYKTRGTCSQYIKLSLDGDVVTKIQFVGGCSGNTQGVAKLATGMTVDQIEKTLSGIRCGMKPTSCPDQLAKAVREAYESAN